VCLELSHDKVGYPQHYEDKYHCRCGPHRVLDSLRAHSHHLCSTPYTTPILQSLTVIKLSITLAGGVRTEGEEESAQLHAPARSPLELEILLDLLRMRIGWQTKKAILLRDGMRRRSDRERKRISPIHYDTMIEFLSKNPNLDRDR
jgi:hypothetical protein